MKTNKFYYRVYYSDENKFQGAKWFDYVTLAEARIAASRHSYAWIQCHGQIEYVNGLEVQTSDYCEYAKKYML